MAQKNTKQKSKKPRIAMLELISINNTAKAREYLKKNKVMDALSYADLQDKLEELYDRAKDKVSVEADFAVLHPHKDFILKYLAPLPTKTKVIIPETTASMEGEMKCNCSACGCNTMSNADGIVVPLTPPTTTKPKDTVETKSRFTSMELIAVVGIVAVVGMMYMHNQTARR